ncbi:MAG: alpha-2-macroglobulin family protein, partial [Bacteroidota bacterium]
MKIKGVKRWKTGVYLLEITSSDAKGQPVEELKYFEVQSGKAKQLTVPKFAFYQNVKMVAEPGEEASFYVGSSAPEANVFYELEYDGTVVEKRWMSLKNEKLKVEVPINESYRGGVFVHLTFVRENRLYYEKLPISVPYTNKMLDISFASFRDKLEPGAKEQWKIIVRGKKANQVAAEMVATLYDQSLDVFRQHAFGAQFYRSNFSKIGWISLNGFNNQTSRIAVDNENLPTNKAYEYPTYPTLNWFRFDDFDNYGMRRKAMRANARMAVDTESMSDDVFVEEVAFTAAAAMPADKTESASFSLSSTIVADTAQEEESIKADLSQVKARTNFNETAFFYPHLQTNENGEIIVNFTIPEALTTWKMLGFAHSKDLKTGTAVNELVTQKNLMVVPNPPRFFRENDRMKFSAKVTSLVDKELNGTAQLSFFDALTMQPVDVEMKNLNSSKPFSIQPAQSTTLEWSIEIPDGLQAISYRIVAKVENFSDGEEMTLPVVTNRMLVTESLPLPVRGRQTKTFRFEKLLRNDSRTLRHHRYTLEFTSNPAWYAIQALPYLMEYPYECVEQTFSRYYANSIAAHVANSSPKIRRVFDAWKNIQPDALLSNLEKNQEL